MGIARMRQQCIVFSSPAKNGLGTRLGTTVLTLGAHAQRELLCHSVRPSVTTFSATTRNKAAKKRCQRVQCHTGLILKRAIFVKVLRSKSYGVKKPIC